MRSRSVAAAGLCLALGACDLFTGAYEYGSVRVRAQSRGSQPVAGVGATLFAQNYVVGSVTTGADGTGVISPVAARQFALRVTAPDSFYLPEIEDTLRARRGDTVYTMRSDTVLSAVFTRTGEEVEVPVTLRPRCCGGVRVRAVTPAGAPVPGTIGVLYTVAYVAGADTAGADGVVAIGGVLDGRFALRVQAPANFAFSTGRDSIIDPVRVREGRDTTLNVVVRPAR